MSDRVVSRDIQTGAEGESFMSFLYNTDANVVVKLSHFTDLLAK